MKDRKTYLTKLGSCNLVGLAALFGLEDLKRHIKYI